MSKPESIKIEPWADFPKYANAIFGDDFVHDKLFVLKVAAKSKRSTVNIKETLTAKGGSFNTADEVKLWFDLPFEGHKLYAKCKSNNYIKLHYDCGIKTLRNRSWNFYGGINCNKSIQNIILKLGANHVSPHCDSDTRVRMETKSSDFNYVVSNRTVLRHDRFHYGLLGVYDLSSRVLQKNAIFVNYHFDLNTAIGFKADTIGFRKISPNPSDWKTYFDLYNLDIVRRLNDTIRLGAQVSLSPRGQTLREVVAVLEKSLPARRTTLKARINNRLDLAVSAKMPLWGLEEIATLTHGFGVRNLAGKESGVDYGWQLDLNI